MAKAAKAAAKKGGKQAGSSSAGWLGGLMLGVLFTALPWAGFAALALFAPLIIVLVGDRSGDRAVARAVGFCNLAAALGPFWHLCTALLGGTPAPDAVMAALGTPLALPAAWLAGATGWALCEILPVILSAAAEWRTTRAIARIDARLEALRHEWGDAVEAETGPQ